MVEQESALTVEQLLKLPPIWQPGQATSRPASRASQKLGGEVEEPVELVEQEVNNRLDAGPHFMSETVREEFIPAIHHAETAAVRAEESTDTSSSEEETDATSTRNIMVSINPPSESSLTPLQSPRSEAPRLEAPPQKSSPWGPSPRLRQEAPDTPEPPVEQHQVFTHSASTFQHHMEAPHHMDAPQHMAPQVMEERDVPPMERSFQDPAFATFHEEKERERQKQKKKGFFSFFKKSSKKKKPYGDDFIHIERRLELDDDDQEEEPGSWRLEEHGATELEGDQSPRFHILQPEARPVVPMPGSTAGRQLFPGEAAGQDAWHLQANGDTNQQEGNHYEEQQQYVEQTQQFIEQQQLLLEQQQQLQQQSHYVEQQQHYTEQQQNTEQQHVEHQQYVEEEQQHIEQPPEPVLEVSVEEFTEEEEPVAALPAVRRSSSTARPTDIDDLILKHNTKMNSYSGERKTNSLAFFL